MENIKISFSPKQRHLDEIAEWMIEEKKTPITSNSNWSSITYAFKNKNLVIATYKNKTVGFYTLSKPEITIAIGVAEVDPNYRKKGIGKLMLQEIIKKYETKNTYAFYLFCAPESSQRIWKKLGFKYFPYNSTNDKPDKVEMYKIIKPCLKSRKSNLKNENEVIEIWNDEQRRTDDDNPTWIFNLKYKRNTTILNKPIVMFGDFDWRIRWRKGTEIFEDCKYKYFDRNNKEFSCMIIEETPKSK